MINKNTDLGFSDTLMLEAFRLKDYNNDFDKYIRAIDDYIDCDKRLIENIQFKETETDEYHYATCYIIYRYFLGSS